MTLVPPPPRAANAPVSGRPIVAWSYSSITMFEQCARKYWAVKVQKIDDTTNANFRGDQEHQSIEGYMKSGRGLSDLLLPAQPLFDRLRAAPGEAYIEYKMALKQDLTVTHGRDWNGVWVRGAGDYVKINGPLAVYADWKSGKAKDKESIVDQTELTSAMLFRHFPAVQEVRSAVYFYRYNAMPTNTVYRTEEPRIWNSWTSRVRALEHAIQTDTWPTNPSPLCGWCPNKACPFNRWDERVATEAQGLKWKYRQ